MMSSSAPQTQTVQAGSSRSKSRVKFRNEVSSSSRPGSYTDVNKNPKTGGRTENRLKSKFPDDTHRCPVCNKSLARELTGLSMKQNFKVYKKDAEFLRKKKEDQWEGRKTAKTDSDTIVAATCGELFHKSCLMKYCSSISRTRSKSVIRHPKCPRCKKSIMYSHFLEVDADGHKCKSFIKFDKEFNQLRLTNEELNHLHLKKSAILRSLNENLDKAKKFYDEVKGKEEDVNANMPPEDEELQKKMLDMREKREHKAWMENYITRAQNVIEYMQKETPNTMRLYLDKVMARPLDEIPKTTAIPRMLIPYLYEIYKDNYSLFALSQIVQPHPYPGATFDTEELLIGILNKVNKPLAEKLTEESKKSNSTLLEVYDRLYPDTCLELLQAQRNNRSLQDLQSPKDKNGNELAITIMYMLNDQDEPYKPSQNRNPGRSTQEEPQVSTLHMVAQKASNCRFDTSSTSLLESVDDDINDALPSAEASQSCSATEAEAVVSVSETSPFASTSSIIESETKTIFFKKNEWLSYTSSVATNFKSFPSLQGTTDGMTDESDRYITTQELSEFELLDETEGSDSMILINKDQKRRQMDNHSSDSACDIERTI